MKDVILLAIGFVSGSAVTAAFGEKVRTLVAGLLTKTAAKVGSKG